MNCVAPQWDGSAPGCGLRRIIFLAILTASCGESWVSAQGFAPSEVNRRLATLPNLRATLFASEPLVRQPILVKCDPRGRLWTIQYLQYPSPAGLQRVKTDRWSRTVYDRVPEPPPRGPRGADVISIVEDHDGDGVAESVRHIIEGLNLATGLEFGHGGLFVMQAPYLLFYPDANRDDVPDRDPDVLLTGFGIEDAQSMPNHLTWGPDGWLYGVTGSTSTNVVREREFQQAVWRYHPRTREFELFCEGGSNLFGLTFDALGQLFFSSNGGQVCYHGVQGAYYEKSFGKHGSLHNLYAYGWFTEIKKLTPQLGGPTTGGTIYLGKSLDDPLRRTFVAGDFLGHTVSWWKIQPRGSTFEIARGGTLLNPHDSWSGPTDVCYGPDGSIYVSDFYDQRTAHPDPDAQWDRSNGRIYRITLPNSDGAAAVDLEALPNQELLPFLTHENHWYRQRARVILSERQDASLWPRLRDMALRSEAPEDALSGLWALAVSGGLDDATARVMLDHPLADVRAWTVRLLGDRCTLSAEVSERCRQLAESDPALVVRSQLASSAQRVSGAMAVPWLLALLDRGLDGEDPYIPWLIWWGLERHALSSRDLLVATWNDPRRAGAAMFVAQRDRLVRRYAAADSIEAETAALDLIRGATADEQSRLLAALSQGLSERTVQVQRPGQGALFSSQAAVSDAAPSAANRVTIRAQLQEFLQQEWARQPTETIRFQLALQTGLPGAAEQAIRMARDPALAAEQRSAALQLLQPFADQEASEALLPLIVDEQPEALLLAALPIVARTKSPGLVKPLLNLADNSSAAIRRHAREVLFSRPRTAKAYLERVAARSYVPDDVALSELRGLAVHGDGEINRLVRQLWGNLTAGTPEEKLAEMRRLNNDLRAGVGNVMRGHSLFKQHCAVCHRLFGDGGAIGPDLTNTSRADREFLLASLVDPSAVIKRQYLTSTIATTNGQTWNGLIAAEDAGSVTLIDSRGERRAIPRADIEEIVESSVSLMPEKLIEKLSPQQLRDLFAYLQSTPPSP
ncbi:MAG: c-type cytochrome [Planctomycetaceae bacterium]|nr:c-type cytochrome [Planctomycetaceae bacterium]